MRSGCHAVARIDTSAPAGPGVDVGDTASVRRTASPVKSGPTPSSVAEPRGANTWACRSSGIDPVLTLAPTFLIGSVVVAMLAVREPLGWVASSDGVLLALWLGVTATGLAYVSYGYGLKGLSSATTVTLVLAEPLTATSLAVLVLDESIVAVAWLGVAGLLAGLMIVGRSAHRSFEPVPDDQPARP